MAAISNEEFQQLMTEGKVQALDVREVDEYQMGHIPEVPNLPLSVLTQRMGELSKEETYYLVCQSGGRSAMAGELLAMQGYKAINVAGGMMSWKGAIC
ncbi:hypothetical protein CBF34_09155 [Vagococcus penaei]|uniref:Uncharacterized protein n=1 Tax=Vagococcus penaei TaxID=633807 RepID=A0A1Q2D628_9ENTE|nr:rhodanese-like domain-containing protein [Vagococcus penaei]AQP53717.1 hypothetical protein BW732_05325 [Vagococcus penaei]RST99465.1 hypothetical protein CBF34_09155 [Vagococcus penaei]